MSGLDLLDEILNDAEDVLHNDSGAQFRLREIIVDEVSLVDRAANKRRFLLIKRDSSGDGMSDNNNSDSQNKGDGDSGFSLTSEAKNAVAAGLSEALAVAVEVANAVKAAEEVEDEKATMLPMDVGKQLRCAASKMLDVLRDHVFKRGDQGQVIEVLVKVAEMSMLLAEEVATSGEVDAEIVARVKQMSELLSAVASDKTDDDDVDKNETRLKEAEKKVEDLQAQVAQLLEAAKGGTPPKKDGDDKIDALTAQVAALAEQMKQGAKPAAGNGDGNADGDKGDDVAKRLDDLEKQNKSLRSKLDKALEDPPSRASTSTRTEKSGGDGPRVFPAVYNHPVHDPQEGA